MKKTPILTLISWIAILCLWLAGCTEQAKPVALTISANPSLKETILEVSELYTQKKPNVTITYNTGGATFLQEQIQQGAPVDIFVTNNAKVIKTLKSQGLVLDNYPQPFIKNQVVLITPKDSTGISKFQDLVSNRVKKVAMGEPENTQTGIYGKEVLTFFKIFDQVKKKAVFGEYSLQLVKDVAAGNADAGIVYRSDTRTSDKIKIVAVAPEDSHSSFVYQIMVIKSSKNIPYAQDFIQFLSGKKAFNKLQEAGYLRVDEN